MKYLFLFYFVIEVSVKVSGLPQKVSLENFLLSQFQFLIAKWSIDKDCQVICTAPILFLFQCERLVTREEFCSFSNKEGTFGCCDYATTEMSTSTASPTTSAWTTSTSWSPTTTTSESWSWASSTPKPWDPRPTVQWGFKSNFQTTTSKPYTFSTQGFHTWTVTHSTPPPTSSSGLSGVTTPTFIHSISEEVVDCAAFSNNPCECRYYLSGTCDYNVITKACNPRQKECDHQMFQGNECGRPNSMYIKAGLSCTNLLGRGNCSVDKNILSVNCNGKEVLADGISYQRDSPMLYHDPHHIRSRFLQEIIWNHSDASLFTTMIQVEQHGENTTDCISYAVVITEPGLYELALRLTEPTVMKTGQRLFNLKLHEEVLVEEIDAFALSGKLNPLNLYFNFEVAHDLEEGLLMTIKGHTPKPIKGPIRLALCAGKCGSGHNSVAILSGFSILRLHGEVL